MRKFLLAGLGVLFLLASAEGALAACTGPAVMHDFPGTSFNMALGQDPSGGCASNVNVLQNGALNVTGNPFYFLFGTGATLPAFASTPTVNLGTLNGAALAANQTNKTQLTQLTDGTNAATTYTNYGTAPTGLVPGVNAAITNTPTVNISQIGGSNVVGDPCQVNARTYTPIAISAAQNTKIVAGTAAKKPTSAISICLPRRPIMSALSKGTEQTAAQAR